MKYKQGDIIIFNFDQYNNSLVIVKSPGISDNNQITEVIYTNIRMVEGLPVISERTDVGYITNTNYKKLIPIEI